MKSYDGLPIVPHLLDLLHAIRDDGITLTLAGGLGLYLKRAEVVRRIQSEGLSTLRPIFPEARGTSDMDLFVHLELFAVRNKEVRLRQVLCGELGYAPTTEFLQFMKSTQAGSGGAIEVKIDLMARDPGPHDPLVKVKDNRVGTTRKRPGSEAIHGRWTPEAFAIDVCPYTFRVEGRRSGGEPHAADLFLPHPFASLMMKLQAVLDRARGLQKSYGYKHAFDVYLLLAMMTEREWDEACGFARETYAREPILMDLKAAAGGLFAADDAPGCIDIRANFEGTREVGEIDLPWMREVLAELMA